MSKFFPIRLTARRLATPSVLHLSFVRDDGGSLDYTPGQFIQIHFPLADGSTARRSYSCATRHDHHMEPGEAVEFVASRVPGGAATALFEGMAIGDCLEASGPLGLFICEMMDFYGQWASHFNTTGCTMHDPCVIAWLLAPHLFSGVRGNVQVAMEGPERGRTVLTPDENGAVLCLTGGRVDNVSKFIIKGLETLCRRVDGAAPRAVPQEAEVVRGLSVL